METVAVMAQTIPVLPQSLMGCTSMPTTTQLQLPQLLGSDYCWSSAVRAALQQQTIQQLAVQQPVLPEQRTVFFAGKSGWCQSMALQRCVRAVLQGSQT